MKKDKYATDFGPISEGCTCYTCKNFTIAYVSQLFKKDSTAIQLLSIHNIHFLIHMLRDLRTAVLEDRAEAFTIDWFKNYYRDDGVPQWVKNALKECDIILN
jgi:queuine tRNA-ribosyltransferase